MNQELWNLAGEALTPKQLRVLELREKHGFSIYQIAYAVDISASTVRGHLRAAHHNLGRALVERNTNGKPTASQIPRNTGHP